MPRLRGPVCLSAAWNSNKAVVSDESLKDRAVALHGDGAGDGLAQQAPPRKGDSKEGKGSLEMSSSKHQLVSPCCDDAVQAVCCPASAGGTAGGPGAAWSWRSASSLHASGVVMPASLFCCLVVPI